MSQYDNSNRGGIWKNDNRQSDNHPHFTGHLNIDGKEYWLSGWKKGDDASERAPLVSLSVRPKDDHPSRKQAAPSAAPVQSTQSAAPKDDFDGDIPW